MNRRVGTQRASRPEDREPDTAGRELSAYVAEVSERSDVRRGAPLPLGAHRRGTGVNFSVFSRHATRVCLELFDHVADQSPSRVIDLDPLGHRTGDIWHAWVDGIGAGQLYGYRVDGPDDPAEGHRFNARKLLLDPAATAITALSTWDFQPACDANDDAGAMPKCIITHEHFHWKDDRPPRHPWSKTVIYETHVRGFTVHPSSGVEHPGTYRGLMEKIPYLQELGVTAVELMPVQEFNEHEVAGRRREKAPSLRNYWGYDPVSFFAPKASYASAGGLGQQVLEFKEMVRALHRAGIEVVLDVVFNHTAEADERGPTLCFRGFDNAIFYILDNDKRRYRDFTGTGNTVNANHPVVRDLILTALRHWVVEMHVDGFRFDLAAVLGRDETGNLSANTPLLERIAEDPILREAKIIAEAWDAAGAYEVGQFSEQRWAEWNGQFRDDVRRFWRGDDGMLGPFAQRLSGSADIYARSGKGPECSINFVTCHDGLTLHDVVSYRDKHNEANGEDNRDGAAENFSDNYGVEGETDDAGIAALRSRQIKNFLLTLFVARGVPMLLGGDEFRRSQAGNNNAYCQDNETSWCDWRWLDTQREVQQFTQRLIAFRRAHPVLSREQFYTDADIRWFAPQGDRPDWNDSRARQLGCWIAEDDDKALCLLFNAGTEQVSFRLPAAPAGQAWRLELDTALARPSATALSNDYQLAPRASAVLVAAPNRQPPD